MNSGEARGGRGVGGGEARRGEGRRLGGSRPALRARGAKPASTARRREANGGPAAKLASVWTDLSRNAGAGSPPSSRECTPFNERPDLPLLTPQGRWMPPRWRGKSKSKHDAAAARRSDSLLTPAADGTLVLVNALSPFAPFRTRAEQEAEAASMGVDFATYMTLIDLQSRDITPEDYDALRNLDSQAAALAPPTAAQHRRAPPLHPPPPPPHHHHPLSASPPPSPPPPPHHPLVSPLFATTSPPPRVCPLLRRRPLPPLANAARATSTFPDRPRGTAPSPRALAR